MNRWTLMLVAIGVFAAGLWHLPATAQHSAPATKPARTEALATTQVQQLPRPVAPQLITFEEYRDFRLRDIAERQARLDRALASAVLSTSDRTELKARKAYYDRLMALPAAERDRLFRARFDQIDTNHDGLIDDSERAAWRNKQRERYGKAAGAPPQAAGANPHAVAGGRP